MTVNEPKKHLSWLGSVTSLLAVATCYGTLALALLGMVYSWRIHPNRHRL